jgi:hypothetical protein
VHEAVETHQEIIEATPKCIREVVAAAGKDGWHLTAMLAVMLPPRSGRRQEQRTASGLVLAETVPDDLAKDPIGAQVQALADGPTPAVLLQFERPLQEDEPCCPPRST